MQSLAAAQPQGALPRPDVATPSPAAIGIRGRYQLPDATMTLREGLAEYYEVNPGLSIPAKLTDRASAAYFHNHDCTHVIFGTHAGLLDEGVNDMLTLFGVDIRFRDYVGGFFASTEGMTIVKQYVGWALVPLLWHTLRLTPTAWRRCRAMTKRWPWAPPERFLDRPLDELRAEFGIELLRPEVELGLVS